MGEGGKLEGGSDDITSGRQAMNIGAQHDIGPGFEDPVFDAQRCFRAVMRALAYPGRLEAVPVSLTPPEGVTAAAAGVLLTLADMDTPLWLDPSLPGSQAGTYFRFHCGCPLVQAPDRAAFALVCGPQGVPRLDSFAPGTPEYPDRSTTVLVQVPELHRDRGMVLQGPGINGRARLEVPGLGSSFWKHFREQHELFPTGVDVLFLTGDGVVALPRTTRVLEEQDVRCRQGG